MTPLRLTFLLGIVVFSCSIVPDGALDYIPSDARVKTISFSGDGATLNGTLTYEGDFGSPSKIKIDWTGAHNLNRAPVVDVNNGIRSTTYLLINRKLVSITNTNIGGKSQRIENFTYDNQDRVKKVVQTNNNSSGALFYELTSDFFYASNEVDSIAQKVCWWDGVCWSGFIVRLDNIRAQVQSLYKSCTDGTSLGKSANYAGIMPYNAGKPYRLELGYGEYWNPATNQYELSMNDFQKTYYYFEYGEQATSFIQTQLYGASIDECKFENLQVDWRVGNAYFGYVDVNFGQYRLTELDFHGLNSQLMNPVYYYAVTLEASEDYSAEKFLVPQVDFVQALNKRIEYLYLFDQQQGDPAPSDELVMMSREISSFEYLRPK